MDSIICLCKKIKKYEIIEAIVRGNHTVEDIKKVTGATSGLCDGKRCTPKIEELIKEYKNYKIEDFKSNQSQDMDSIVCLCKQVKKSEIIEEIKNGCDSIEKLKEKILVTSGVCCGKRCASKIQELIKIHSKSDA